MLVKEDGMSMKITNGFQIVQDLIKLRWVPKILTSIEGGNNRYSELLESIRIYKPYGTK